MTDRRYDSSSDDDIQVYCEQTNAAIKPYFDLGNGLDLTLIVILGTCATFAFGTLPEERFFIERDPRFSYPFEEEQISTIELGVIALVPAFVVLAITAASRWWFPEDKWPRVVQSYWRPLFAVIEGLTLSFFLVEAYKLYFGSYRPHFFDLCNYKGYSDALKTGNFTEYLALTTPGVPGSLKHCRDKKELEEIMSSTPSGHSMVPAGSFSVLSVFLYLYYVDRKDLVKNIGAIGQLGAGIVVVAPFVIAVLLAGTRVVDYHHHLADIILGLMFGFICGLVVAAIRFHPAFYRSRSRKALAGGSGGSGGARVAVAPSTEANGGDGEQPSGGGGGSKAASRKSPRSYSSYSSGGTSSA